MIRLKNMLHLAFVICLFLRVGASARAFTTSNSAAAWQSYKQQFFYVINGNEGYFRNQQGVGYTTTTYQLAYDIEAAVDAQDVTVVNQTINGFVALYGTNPASWDVAEDDNMTFALVFAAAYQLTGNANHLAMAKSNFDTCYNRAWDPVNGGLVRISGGVKSAQVNGPGCLAAYLIYQSGGGSAYLTKAQNIYNWMLANVWNSSTGQVNATPGDTSNPLSSDASYFAACSHYLGYPGNVTLAGNFVKNRWGTGMQGFGPGSFLGSVNSINLRWLAKSGFDIPFLQACCDRGLTCMNASGLVGPDFNQPTSNAAAYSFDCTNIVAGLMCVPPSNGPSPGAYAVYVRSTGLALDANGASTANGTALTQSGYHAGSNQKWNLNYLGNGQYSMIGVGSGRAVEVNGYSQNNNATVDIWDYIGAGNQKFTLVDQGSGYYNIAFVHSGKAMQVLNNSTAWGAAVVQYTLGANGYNAQWKFQAP